VAAVGRSRGRAGVGSALAVAAAGSSDSTDRTSAVAAPADLRDMGSGDANGTDALATVDATVNNPGTIQLRLSVSQLQSVSVSWDALCEEVGGGVGEKNGQVTADAPTSVPVPIPSGSTSCDVSAEAQLSQSGDLTISVWG
jgi:hypothetical protein